MACQGLRVLACAFKTDLGTFSDYDGLQHPAHQALINADIYSSIESELTFVGLCGLQVSDFPKLARYLWNNRVIH